MSWNINKESNNRKMKINNVLQICLLCVLLGTGMLVISMIQDSKEKVQLKLQVKQLENEVQELKNGVSNIKIISPVIDMTYNYANKPSYCDPKKFSIVKSTGYYLIKLPHGTIDTDIKYLTPEEAQIAINERAARSLQKWIDSGGTDF